MKNRFCCKLSQSQLGKLLEEPKRTNATWKSHIEYMRAVASRMGGNPSKIILEYFCSYSFPSEERSLLAKIDQDSSEYGTELEKSTRLLTSIKGNGKGFVCKPKEATNLYDHAERYKPKFETNSGIWGKLVLRSVQEKPSSILSVHVSSMRMRDTLLQHAHSRRSFWRRRKGQQAQVMLWGHLSRSTRLVIRTVSTHHAGQRSEASVINGDGCWTQALVTTYAVPGLRCKTSTHAICP